MDEADFLDRTRRVAEAFRPAAPINRRDLFAGRAEQIGEVFSIVSQPGQHAIIYGERGVGKTSLGLVAAELLRAANVLSAWATCDASDDFSSVWGKALGEIGFRPRGRRSASGSASMSRPSRSRGCWRHGEVTPHAVQGALQQAAGSVPSRSSSTSSTASRTRMGACCSLTRSRPSPTGSSRRRSS